MDYLCAKFGDCTFSRFGFIMQTDRHRIRDASKRLTHVTIISVSNKLSLFRYHEPELHAEFHHVVCTFCIFLAHFLLRFC